MQFTNNLLFLTPESERTTYRSRAKIEKNTVHWASRKLFLDKLSFLALFWKPSELAQPQVLFINAAPGGHIDLLAQFFPQMTFHLYDQKPFLLTDNVPNQPNYNSNKAIININNFAFTHDIARTWANRNDVIFVSDYSSPNTPAAVSDSEDKIKVDMLVQQDWYDLIKPKLALVKFRLPYPRPDGPTSFKYLSGFLLKPIWGPASATETRLVPNNLQIEWNLKWYEETMAYFNQTLRESTVFINPITNSLAPVNAPELLSDFDSAAEAFVLAGYIKTRYRNYTLDQVVKLSNYITTELDGWSTIKTSLAILRQLPAGEKSTVIRQLNLSQGKRAGINAQFQKRVKGKAATVEVEES